MKELIKVEKRDQNSFISKDEKSNDQTIKQINEMYATGVVEELDEWANQKEQAFLDE